MVPKTKRLNAIHYFIMKMTTKRELQQIASNHLSDIEFKHFMKLCKDYTKMSDTDLPSDNPLGFRKKLFQNVL